MREIYRNNKIFIDKLLLLVSIAAFLALAVFLAGYIVPFVAGYIISLVLSPLVGLIHRKWRINRGVVAAILILGLLTALFFLGRFLVGRIVSEIADFAEDIPYYLGSVQGLFENMAATIQNFFGASFEIDFAVLQGLLETLASSLLQGLLEGGTFITAIPAAIIRVILAIISAFFFIKDKELIKQSIAALLPERLLVRLRLVREGILKALVGYAKGQLIVMSYVSAISVLGLTIIGSPYSLFIGIGIGVFDLIPIFGAGGILIPWAVYHLIVGNFAFAIGLLVIYGVIFLTRQIMEPRIVGKQIGIHPLILLMSVYVGVSTIGPVGLLAGPLIVLTIKTTMEANPAVFTTNETKAYKLTKKNSGRAK